MPRSNGKEVNGVYKKVSCLGPEGSYSHIAACAMCAGAQVLLCRTFRAAVQAVISGRADACVLPIENTLNGGVLQNMDMLQAEDGLTAVAEYTLPIDHRLITLAGADKSRIERIYSHRQALDQCAGFLQEHYPDAELVPERSTAASVDCIKTPREAAIAGVQCAREGLDVSPECISDEKNNFTHFLLVTKGSLPEDFKSSRVYFALVCNHVPGALMQVLAIIYGCNLNMTKIESRPIKNEPGEYRFFIEVVGDYSSEEMKHALAILCSSTRSFRLIGAY